MPKNPGGYLGVNGWSKQHSMDSVDITIILSVTFIHEGYMVIPMITRVCQNTL
jgi:hypothetical protein